MKRIRFTDTQLDFERKIRIVVVATIILVLTSYVFTKAVYSFDGGVESIERIESSDRKKSEDVIEKEVEQKGSSENKQDNRKVTPTNDKYGIRSIQQFDLSEPIQVNSKKKGDELLKGIKAKYKSVGSPLAHEVEWLFNESMSRGLNPSLVFAIQAQESGWGRYCHANNCFGYGATDSENLPQYFQEKAYRDQTTMILDKLAKCSVGKYCYKVDTAEQMSANGYNFNQSWVNSINKMMSYWD